MQDSRLKIEHKGNINRSDITAIIFIFSDLFRSES